MSHIAALHVATPFEGTGQALPQPPQLAVLVVVSTHAFPQAVIPSAHEVWQVPDEQTSFAPHTTSQAPQWSGSVFLSTQTSPHRTNIGPQMKSQPVVEQTGVPLAGASQTVSQLPQWSGSATGFTQLPPHEVSPESHAIPHFPPAHVACPPAGLGHAVWQSPQWSGLVSRSTQEPLQAVSPLTQLFAHPLGPHTSPTPQTVSHLPQCFGSLFSSTHSPPHTAYPISQATPQAEPVQSAEP
jgi:hypothetical protein